MLKTALSASLVLALASPALAGGFSDAIVEPIVRVEPAQPAARGSLPGWVIPAAVLAALVAAAAASDSDDDSDETPAS